MKPTTTGTIPRYLGRRLGASTLIAGLAGVASAAYASEIEEAESPFVTGTLVMSLPAR